MTESLNNSDSVPMQKRRILCADIASFKILRPESAYSGPVCSRAAAVSAEAVAELCLEGV